MKGASVVVGLSEVVSGAEVVVMTEVLRVVGGRVDSVVASEVSEVETAVDSVD